MEPPLNYVTGPNDRYHLNQFRGFLNYIRLKVTFMEQLDSVTRSTLQDANISAAVLPTLSRDDIRDLFPGPENFLRRKTIWETFHRDKEGQEAGCLNQNKEQEDTGLTPTQTPSEIPVTTRHSIFEPSGHPPRTLKLPNPEYVVYTDSELEHVRKEYFDLQRVGQERDCNLSKELRCRLVRNTVTNMVSIMRASSTDFMYPSKNDMLAMAKRLVEYYPMLRDDSVNCKHIWDSIFKQLMKRLQNIRTPKKKQGPTPQRKKKRRLDFDYDGDSSSCTLDSAESSSASAVMLETRESSTPPSVSTKPLAGTADQDLPFSQTDNRRDEDHSDTDSQQSQARHYHTLQEIYKRSKPNKEAVAQLLDLEFDARRAFINSDCFKDQDRPSKILQAYPCFRELQHVMDELGRILEKGNPRFIPKLKARWESFCSKAQFYGVYKKVLKPPMTLDGVKRSIALMKALPEMFPSPVAPPKKMGHPSEAMLHILEPTENPDSFLKGRPLFSPVLIVSEDNCMLAIGTTPVTIFPQEDLHEGVLYLMAYYYALHLVYPKSVATLLSVLQTEVISDAIHGRDATSSYKKATLEWKKFIGE
ncbi:uncharacterized protein LOC113092877 isoform X2 [Carassius auratus]|uniref:Uncharacterized protein LOC113092877 isoform X2 n=1 Tax=Carassius auratus TaxID=7957 RepID=A0A6P6P146_CARAU|nr:uncharacterized protein LOC113092877 isoform X2 [Carassius auratus]